MIGNRRSRRQWRGYIPASPPEPPVAGWVPPRLKTQSPQPQPEKGYIDRGLPPALHPNYTDFTLNKSRKVRSYHTPSRGSLSRRRVPLQALVAVPRVLKRVRFPGYEPELADLLGSVKRTLCPQRLFLRRTLQPPFCWHGEVYSPGAVAGEAYSPGIQAGQVGCRD